MVKMQNYIPRRNRKGYFSLNVQAVCDTKLMFMNIVCWWPGSTHDSRIFDNSALCSQFRNGLIDGILLGDRGYPCCHYLMTPVLNPMTSKERRYNRAHIATCGMVERMFGLWKSRFRCISIPLRTSLKNTQHVSITLPKTKVTLLNLIHL